MNHNEEVINSESTEGESQGVDIYKGIRQEIHRVIDWENPNEKGQDHLEEFYNSESEGRDIYDEI